jgi:hypothetical protein
MANYLRILFYLIFSSMFGFGAMLTTVNISAEKSPFEFGGQKAVAFNPCSQTARKETKNGDIHVIAHANKCGEYYTYMNPAAGNWLKYKLVAFKTDAGFLGIGEAATKIFPFAGPLTIGYAWRADKKINNIEYCSSQNKGMWINANSYTAFLNARVTCN